MRKSQAIFFLREKHSSCSEREDEVDQTNCLLSLINCRGFYIREQHPKLKKAYWWQMIQLLPSSYNQKRTVMLNYEVLANIYKSRKSHKLAEWAIGFMEWIKTLPYSELITWGQKE